MSPSATRPARSGTLSDLRPNAAIHCFLCLQSKPQASALKFRAHHVCADCAAQVRARAAKAQKENRP